MQKNGDLFAPNVRRGDLELIFGTMILTPRVHFIVATCFPGRAKLFLDSINYDEITEEARLEFGRRIRLKARCKEFMHMDIPSAANPPKNITIAIRVSTQEEIDVLAYDFSWLTFYKVALFIEPMLTPLDIRGLLPHPGDPIPIEETTPSGKQLFYYRCCGRKAPTPDKLCYPNVFVQRISGVYASINTAYYDKEMVRPEWVEDLHRQCRLAEVPFTFQGYKRINDTEWEGEINDWWLF
jgi:hypothetical protein